MSEWLKIVLAEIDRKCDEFQAARDEQDRRAKSAEGSAEAPERGNRSDRDA
jgi:hypothetical protein